MRVTIWTDASSWDAYVESQRQASNYHRWVWKRVVEETYGHTTHYLAAESGGALEGVLPLVGIRSRLFGRSLVSMPFFSYGGPVASSPEARNALLFKAVQIAHEFGARRIELRQGSECDLDWQVAAPKVTMLVNLPASADVLWNSLSTGIRNKIRSARKRGLVGRWNGIEALDVFYPIFATNMRNLGTPVYPRSWFENLCRHAGDGTRILSVWDGARPVAAGIMTTFRDTVDWPWSASTAESRRKYSAVFLYWLLLEWAVNRGYRVVDLGRCTPGGGTYEFKRHWRCEERPLHWYYWLAAGESRPEPRRDAERFRWATRVWQRLPLGVANRLGPLIVRAIP